MPSTRAYPGPGQPLHQAATPSPAAKTRQAANVSIRKFLNQLFADDQAMFLLETEQLLQALVILKEVTESWGLVINYDKTKGMIYRPPSMGPPEAPPPSHWTLPDGHRIELVKTFKYVGGLTSCDGSQAPAIARRISTASFAFKNLQPVLKAHSGADMATHRVLYNFLPLLTLQLRHGH